MDEVAAALLRTEKVSKRFGSLVAVDSVSIEVRPGEIFGIAGPNGAGKTTLFNLITGIPFGPDRGSVWLENRRIDRVRPSEVARLGVVRTFQRETVFASLPVRQNIEIALAHSLRTDTAIDVDAALQKFGLKDVIDQPAAQLPHHQKKLLMLASAWVMNPRVLLLDEPASGLNRPETAALERVIRDLRGEGLTIVLIEHVLPLLLAVSDRVLIMDHGTSLLEGSPSSVLRDPRVLEAYLGERGRKLAGNA